MSRKPELRGRAARLARLFPTRPSGAARTPFVLLVVVLLGGGLITLLMLNSALNAGSFELSELRKDTTSLTEERQELERDVDGYSAPGALQRRAEELGMVPGGDPVFLAPDGTLRGVPGVAEKSAHSEARPSARTSPRPKRTPTAAPSARTGSPAPTARTSAAASTPAPGARPGAAPSASAGAPTPSTAPQPAPSTSGQVTP